MQQSHTHAHTHTSPCAGFSCNVSFSLHILLFCLSSSLLSSPFSCSTSFSSSSSSSLHLLLLLLFWFLIIHGSAPPPSGEEKLPLSQARTINQSFHSPLSLSLFIPLSPPFCTLLSASVALFNTRTHHSCFFFMLLSAAMCYSGPQLLSLIFLLLPLKPPTLSTSPLTSSSPTSPLAFQQKKFAL